MTGRVSEYFFQSFIAMITRTESISMTDKEFLGENREWLIVFCREVLAKEHFDFFIFGHRHFALDFKLNSHSRYINLGDWIRDFTYAYFDGNDLYLRKWEE